MRTTNAITYFLDSCRARQLSPLTVRWYERILLGFAAKYPEIPKEPRPIEKYLSTCGKSAETKRSHFAVLRAFFRFINARQGLPDPLKKVHPPRPDRNRTMATLEPRELMSLLNSASSPRDRAILTLLIDTGIRSGELANLQIKDIREEMISVRGKSGHRNVPISEETARLLLALTHGGDRNDHVFQGHKGPLRSWGIYNVVHSHMKKAGIDGPKLGAHRIRHAFGKNYLVNGGDLRSLQLLMGHSDISTTQKYANLTDRDIVRKHHQFTPLRAAQAAAQGSFLEADKAEAVKAAEQILKGKSS